MRKGQPTLQRQCVQLMIIAVAVVHFQSNELDNTDDDDMYVFQFRSFLDYVLANLAVRECKLETSPHQAGSDLCAMGLHLVNLTPHT